MTAARKLTPPPVSDEELLAELRQCKSILSLGQETQVLASLLARLVPVADGKPHKALKDSPAATDGHSLFLYPAFIRNYSPSQRQFILCHEVWHCVCEHVIRRGDRKPLQWNVAVDVKVNRDLIRLGLDAPFSEKEILLPKLVGLTDQQADAMSAEQVYAHIMKKTEEEQNQPQPQFGEDCQDTPPGEKSDGEDGETQAQANRRMASKWAEAMIEVQNMASMLDSAIEARQGQGNRQRGEGSVSGVFRLAQAGRVQAVDWRSVIGSIIASFGVRYDWKSFERRSLHLARHGDIVPSRKPALPAPIGVVIDVSGSIGHKEKQAAITHISQIADTYGTSILAIYCDTEVIGGKFYGPDEARYLSAESIPDGGGTQLAPAVKVMKSVAEGRWDALGAVPGVNGHAMDIESLSALVVITDGYTDDPATYEWPEIPAVWLKTDARGLDAPPWAANTLFVDAHSA